MLRISVDWLAGRLVMAAGLATAATLIAGPAQAQNTIEEHSVPASTAAQDAGHDAEGTTKARPVTRAVTPAGPESLGYRPDAECQRAVDTLARTDGKDAAAAAVYDSPRCKNLRDAYAFDVRGGMAQMIALLRDEGIDFDERIVLRMADCEREADRRMARTVPAGETAPSRGDVVASCRINAESALYAEGVVALQDARAKRFAASTAETDTTNRRLAREAEESRLRYEREMEVYNAAVRRREQCEAGQTEYCIVTPQ